ncbi:DUF1853 family protein [Flagellimonas allohymeniacidonis]|uniref:DUF1853 family protein n=1 Tax=Flagellimonas allohymeniacidonis TaxID=2517819 RepID=A0A4Q8QKJ1_9FLAO|nr:DUF1853 family protein [Allomuricauda hymeniacidonis]TAI48756.1 DUF1853 family protein [Allomuricauda hymeniacidonis]
MLNDMFIGFNSTPPLWSGTQFGVGQFDFPSVDFENFSPKSIPGNIRLGHKMEHVFAQLIEWEGSYEILLQNISIKNGKNTIGEIDFVLSDQKRDSFLHVELTYKFYIIDPSISEPIHRLMGPNRRDMFFTKLEKIKKEQFALVQKEEARQKLLERNVDLENLEQFVCYKAQLFQPYESEKVHIRPLNNACVVGHWLRFKDFEGSAFSSYQFYIPFKQEWVIAPHENVQWSSHFEILMEINLRMIKQNAPMVWMRKSQNEFEKFFVVWW